MDNPTGTAPLRIVKPAPDPEPAAGYRELLEGFYDAVLITDLEGRILDANARAEQFLQTSCAALCAGKLDQIISGLDPEVMERTRQHCAAGRFTVLDAYCLRPDRSTFPAEIAMRAIRWQEQGRLVITIRNIEKRRQTQALLRRARNALQSAASGLVITDPAGIIEYANPAFPALWGWPASLALKGRDIRAFWDPPSDADPLVSHPREGRTWQGELRGIHQQGRPFFVQASAAPQRNSAGTTVGVVSSFIDITDRKMAEETIRREAEAQRREARRADEFSGALNILPLTDIIQLIQSTSKSGTLLLFDDQAVEQGSMGFREGQLLSALTPTRDGESAVYELLAGDAQAFRFMRKAPEAVDHPITKPTMTLLLEAMQQMDETRGNGS